ncbi:MAG: XRE family transcriptional regulator [Porticoccaceae bacterium]|nr:XRE family transcriptional regulator [Porticoccaceae bacterium]
MTQASALVDTLKRVLKQHQLTYGEVARRLGMSEANIKRQFASRRFSLERLEAICQLIPMELSDLFYLYESSRQRINQLTREQEEELVRDRTLLLVAVSVRNGLSFDEIVRQYAISATECIRCLAALDRLKLIDLLPGNHIRLRIDEDFRWLPNGPIERFFEQQVLGQFLRSGFHGELEQRLFVFGLLSEASASVLHGKLQRLAADLADLHRQDARLPLSHRHTVMLLAMRPWEAEVFKPFLRTPDAD